LVGKAASPSQVAHPSHISKLLIPWKKVQFHCAWCHCSHLCCHPWQVSSVLKPESFPCLLVFEIQIPFIYLQAEVQIKLMIRSRFFSKQNTCTVRTKAVDRERNKTRKLATAVSVASVSLQ
jgi:hypothetical protein